MRSSKSRSRGNKNRNLRPSGGNIINRVFDSSGPDGKVRGTPAQIIEKYTQLHRDAQLSGDRVGAENFAQHAEHYTRMLAEAQREIDRAREEQEQFNRERQAERDREMQREREARAERDREREAQRQGERGERERDRERHRPQVTEREAPAGDMPAGGTGLPAFLTHGFSQSATSLEEGDFDAAGAAEDSGLVETPEMRDLVREQRPARAPRQAAAQTAAPGPATSEETAAVPGAGEEGRPARPPRARKPRARPADDEDGAPVAAAQ